MLWRIWLGVAVAAVAASGCAQAPRLNADLPAAELRSRLDADFQPGMSLEQVQARLDEAGVRPRRWRVYPGPPVQMLARLFPAGGFWVDHQRDWQETPYVDAWFVFGDQGLERVDTERRVVRLARQQYLDPPFHTPELLPREPRAVGR